MSDNIADLVARLEEEAERLSGHSIDRSSVDAGISSNLATEAAQALTRIAEERDEARNQRDAYRDERDSLTTIVSTGIDDVAGAELDDLESRAQAAEVERDRLKKLLQPLADEAETWGPETGPESTWGNSVELWQSPSRRTKITVGDARRASEALRGEKP